MEGRREGAWRGERRRRAGEASAAPENAHPKRTQARTPADAATGNQRQASQVSLARRPTRPAPRSPPPQKPTQHAASERRGAPARLVEVAPRDDGRVDPVCQLLVRKVLEGHLLGAGRAGGAGLVRVAAVGVAHLWGGWRGGEGQGGAFGARRGGVAAALAAAARCCAGAEPRMGRERPRRPQPPKAPQVAPPPPARRGTPGPPPRAPRKRAFLKCVDSRSSRMGCMSTSFTTTATSLPLKPSVEAPRSEKSCSDRLCGVSPRWTLNMCARAGASGSGM
jgi:hypothetical protein